MVSIYPLMLSVCCVWALNLHTLYLKELAQKQSFKNLPVSLAELHQKMEYCNFINNQLTPNAHPLFATETKFGVMKFMEDNGITDIQMKFQRSRLLPGVTLKSVYAVTVLPKFWKIERISQVLGFVYFELTKFNTEVFSK